MLTDGPQAPKTSDEPIVELPVSRLAHVNI